MKKYNVAVVGATGLVGRTILKILEERSFPIENMYLLASKKSAGTFIYFRIKDYAVEELKEESFQRAIDFVFFAAVIVSDVLFVLGAFDIVRLSIDAPLSLIWMLAYALFVTETFISLSLERGEGSLSNLLLIGLMYFTYCQLWIILVFKALYESLKDKIQGKGFHWYKTERSSN